jgi:hypothetical protein
MSKMGSPASSILLYNIFRDLVWFLTVAIVRWKNINYITDAISENVTMSKAEILAELQNLQADDRAQVLERLCELQEADLLHGVGPSAGEKKLLDEALAEFEFDGDRGMPWREALNRIRSSSAE